jgi:ribosomal protein L7/L12
LEKLDYALNSILSDYSKSITSQKDIDFKIKVIRFYKQNSQHSLRTVKLIKDETGWGLKESKDYFDNEIKTDLNFEIKMKLKVVLDGEN